MSNKIKSEFPIFKTYPGLIYLDSASTSQKPQVVIDAVSDFYTRKNANIHRGIYKLAEDATAVYETTRDLTAKFINANSRNEIIFTGNTNQSINLFAEGWGRKFLKKGDVVVLSEMEHHANIVPWLRLKDEIGIEIEYLPISEDGRLLYEFFLPSPYPPEGKIIENPVSVKGSATGSVPSSLNTTENLPARVTRSGKKLIISKIKLISLTHISNVLGTVNPIEEIIAYFKKLNPDSKIFIDAAQSIPHMPVNVKKLDADAIAFSAHKMLGPAGVGVLWAKESLLEAMNPLFVGSHMIKKVSKEKATFADLPEKFEVGTGNLEGVAGLGAAISYLQKIGMETITAHDKELTEYGLKKLLAIPYLKLHGPKTSESRIGIFSFALPGVHPHDIAQVLDSENIAIRSGHHCCQVLMDVLGVPATARASFYLYNSKEDVDRLVDGIEKVKKIFKL